jgi:hypothetical protein
MAARIVAGEEDEDDAPVPVSVPTPLAPAAEARKLVQGEESEDDVPAPAAAATVAGEARKIVQGEESEEDVPAAAAATEVGQSPSPLAVPRTLLNGAEGVMGSLRRRRRFLRLQGALCCRPRAYKTLRAQWTCVPAPASAAWVRAVQRNPLSPLRARMLK